MQSVSRKLSPAPRTRLLIKRTSKQFSIEQYTSFGIDRVSGTRGHSRASLGMQMGCRVEHPISRTDAIR